MLKRVKRRYLALEIDSERMPNSEQFIDSVWIAIFTLYGECGACKTGLSLIEYDQKRHLAVLRVVHSSLDEIKAALTSITEIAQVPTALHVLRISGTLKALRRKAEL